jgi:hypothetical protein
MTPEQITAFMTSLTGLLTDIGSILAKVISMAGSVVTFITTNPLILLVCITPLAGLAFITVRGFLHR